MTFDEICRRASGRRRYNADRRAAATRRREAVSRLTDEGKSQADIALALGVSRSTISRDQARRMLYFLVGRRKAQRMTVRECADPFGFRMNQR